MSARISSARIVAAARTVASSYGEEARSVGLGVFDVPGWVVPPPALEQAPTTRLRHNRNPNLTEVLQAME
jgi:hypothetical protein